MKSYLLSILLMLFCNILQAQTTITITNGNDSGAGSLRQAISDATSNDTLVFEPSVTTITLTSDQIVINKNITIKGGTNKVTITRSSASDFRCFYSYSTTTNYNINLQNLVFTNFKASDGSSSTLTSGGVIHYRNYGNLSIINCNFSQNQAGNGTTSTSAGNGGAIYSQYGNVQILNCSFSENVAGSGLLGTAANGGGGGNGGAIGVWSGFLNVENTQFIMNEAGAGGNSTSNNGGSGGAGGAVYARDIKININNCSFDSNSAGKGGNGINDGGDGGMGGVFYFYVTDSVIIKNSNLVNNSSGMGGNGTNQKGGKSGDAGVFYINATIIAFLNCTFDGNLTSVPGTGNTSNGASGYGGVGFIRNDADFFNCSFYNNKTGNSSIYTGHGGVLYIMSGQININRCYFENNRTGNSTNSWSGDGGVLAVRSSINIANSLFYNNRTGNGNILSGKGGCIYANGFFVFLMANNTFAENFTGDAGTVGSGGAISNSNDSTTYFVNSVFYNNNIGAGNGGYGNDIYSYDMLNAANCLVSDTLNSKISGPNIIVGSNPQFFNGFNLFPTSPCINTGLSDTTGLYIGNYDLNDSSRIVGRNIDIGAFEYQTAVTTGIITQNSYYVSQNEASTVQIPYFIEGEFDSENQFIAMLSDSNGSFDNPVNIGTIFSIENGTIEGTIPAGTLSGDGYRIRIRATHPPVFDNGDNGTDIEIVLIANSISPSENQNIFVNQNGEEISVYENIAPDSREWKYSTTSGSGYISFEIPQTGIMYVPNFSNEGTYFVVCQSYYNIISENVISNEVAINVTTIPTYTVSYSSIGTNGTITASVNETPIFSGADVEEGSDINFTATPNENYFVRYWYVNGSIQPNENGNNFVYENLQENITVTVEFDIIDNIKSHNNLKIRLYPCPTNGILKISSEVFSIKNIEINDLTGRIIFSCKQKNQKDAELDMSMFKCGIYSLKIETENGSYITKIIKQ